MVGRYCGFAMIVRWIATQMVCGGHRERIGANWVSTCLYKGIFKVRVMDVSGYEGEGLRRVLVFAFI